MTTAFTVGTSPTAYPTTSSHRHAPSTFENSLDDNQQPETTRRHDPFADAEQQSAADRLCRCSADLVIMRHDAPASSDLSAELIRCARAMARGGVYCDGARRVLATPAAVSPGAADYWFAPGERQSCSSRSGHPPRYWFDEGARRPTARSDRPGLADLRSSARKRVAREWRRGAGLA